MKNKSLFLLVLFYFASLICQAQEAASSRLLLNGKDLTGWRGDGFIVEDGVTYCQSIGKPMVTEGTFVEYILDFDFKLKGDQVMGLSLHYAGVGDPSEMGMQVQMLNNQSDSHKDLSSSQRNGSLFRLAAAKPANLKPAGDWNHQRVTVTAKEVIVEQNGEAILKADLDEIRLRNPQHAGLKRRSGHIAIWGDGEKTAFKNVTLKEIPPLANVAGAIAAGYVKLGTDVDLKGWKPQQSTAWSMRDGILSYHGSATETAALWTEKDFTDFTLLCDWRWSSAGPMEKTPSVEDVGTQKKESFAQNSRIFLRGSRLAEVNFTNTPVAKANRPAGEWNRTLIEVKGDLVSVMINGQWVIQKEKIANLPARGPIGIEDGRSGIQFSNLWIKGN